MVLADAPFLIPSFVLDLRAPPMHSRAFLVAVSTVLGFMTRAVAQTEPAECPSGWEWVRNLSLISEGGGCPRQGGKNGRLRILPELVVVEPEFSWSRSLHSSFIA